jgi:nucleoside-diphosphate-sugar epimerase
VSAPDDGRTRSGEPRAIGAATCVVTGGLGFIGSNLVHRLVTDGARVRIVDALVPDHGGDRRNVSPLAVDVVIDDIGSAAAAECVRDADIVFNLAGQVSHTASMRDPGKDLHLNAVTHSRFLENVRVVNPDVRIVHASTRQVYGRAIRVPVDEDHPANPVDVNGVAKLAGEHLHLVYARAHGMPITSLRLTNVYGPRQRLTSDELGFLPVFIRHALLGEPIALFGDGSQRRDCLHVDDVVDAMLAAVDGAGVGRVFNVGNDIDHSLADIADLVVRLAGTGSTIARSPWPADHHKIDIGSFRSDSGLIARELGWKASIGLEDGLRSTLAFYRDHPWYLSST